MVSSGDLVAGSFRRDGRWLLFAGEFSCHLIFCIAVYVSFCNAVGGGVGFGVPGAGGGIVPAGPCRVLPVDVRRILPAFVIGGCLGGVHFAGAGRAFFCGACLARGRGCCCCCCCGFIPGGAATFGSLRFLV